MPQYTSKLKLIKPSPAENVDVGQLNSNSDAIDDNIGAKNCTSTTRPSQPFVGQHIFETDTGNVLFWDGSEWKYTAEDTGWISEGFTYSSAYEASGNVLCRRKNGIVFFRGGVSRKTGQISTAYEIAVRVPTGFRPAFSTRVVLSGSYGIPVEASINVEGQINLRQPAVTITRDLVSVNLDGLTYPI